MTADEILKKHEDENEYHLHEVDRKWVIAAMEEYAALRQPLVSSSFSSESSHICMMNIDKERTCMVCGKQNCC